MRADQRLGRTESGHPPAVCSRPSEGAAPASPPDSLGEKGDVEQLVASRPTRFHGTVAVDATRVGRDASRIADEVIAHLVAIVGASVKVTIEVEAEIPSGAPDNVVRIVTENSRTLGFTSQGFEDE